jgi:hypothetical protein
MANARQKEHPTVITNPPPVAARDVPPGENRAFKDHRTMEQVMKDDAQARKETPMARGLLDYFPLALAAVAHLSFVATQQHHPNEEMHWNREISTDHADCIVRHLLDRGKVDTDGQLHSVKVAWRALALLQIELENMR